MKKIEEFLTSYDLHCFYLGLECYQPLGQIYHFKVKENKKYSIVICMKYLNR